MLPEIGAFNATFKFAKGLARQGHQVTYLGPPEFAAHVARQGLQYFPLEVPKSKTEEQARTSFWLSRIIEHYRFAERFKHAVDAGFEIAFRTIDPDIVVLDPLVSRYAAPICKLGLPIVGVNTTLASTFSWLRPPVFSGIIPCPQEAIRDRVKSLSAWLRIKVSMGIALPLLDRGLGIIALGPARARQLDSKRALEDVGAKLAWGEYGWRLVAPELVLSPKAFDFPRCQQPSRHYIGACVDRERDDGEFNWKSIKPQEPLIYCSLGTYSHAYPFSKKLFKAVAEAISQQSKWQVIIQVGDVAAPEEFGPLPDHVLVVKTTPQLMILARAKIFITHGGFSSVREACLLGVPMIVFPCWLDQPGNAARVVYHRIGVRADIKSVDAGKILRLIDEVTVPEVQRSMQKMISAFQEEEDCLSGINWLETYMTAKLK